MQTDTKATPSAMEALRVQTYEEAFRAGREAGIAAAAKIAEPPLAHRVGDPGMWRKRRAKIAADIKALSWAKVAEENEQHAAGLSAFGSDQT